VNAYPQKFNLIAVSHSLGLSSQSIAWSVRFSMRYNGAINLRFIVIEMKYTQNLLYSLHNDLTKTFAD
jgi:hypothetical protein